MILFPSETLAVLPTCPAWCTSRHGVHDGEEDWVHLGAPVRLTDGVAARLCTSRDPLTGTEDGPLLLIGDTEYHLDEAIRLVDALAALTATATSS